jgi:hypothetical protein
MKKYLGIFSAIAASALMIGQVSAGSDSKSVTVNATVAASCSLTQTSAQATYNLPAITNGSGTLISQTLNPVQVATVTCNGPATVTANSTVGGLKLGSGACVAANCIAYDAFVKVGSLVGNTINVAGPVPTTPSSVALTGITNAVPVQLSVNPTTTLASSYGAGTYTDVVTLTVNF